jgi:hypothetical protein
MQTASDYREVMVQLCVLLHPGVTNVLANPLPEEIMYTATHIEGQIYRLTNI